MITSPANARVKWVRRLQSDRRTRIRERLFVVEGRRWASELVRQQTPTRMIFYTESWLSSHSEILQQLEKMAQQPATAVSDSVMAAMSDTITPSGLLAVVPIPDLPLPPEPDLLLILDRLKTPGNLGTILRSAGAAGVSGVILGPGCVDHTNPKVVRGSMGALLRLPIYPLSWAEIQKVVRGMAIWVATVGGGTAYTAVNWKKPSALIIGSEAHGAGKEALKLAHGRVTIPMQAETESLNAALAASVILFEAKRQREL
jgi:TrmH family RNA methyltransferase